MLKFCSLASGSSGNSYYISSGNTAILVDAGISCARITKAISHIGESPQNLDAIVLTHEHSDHVKGLRVLSKKIDLALYATGGTRQNLENLEECAFTTQSLVAPGKAFKIGDIEITGYNISHDAAEPVCYKISSGGATVGIVTDLGWADPDIIDAFSDCDLMLLEANHDVELLKIGPYPAFLKQRILSRDGHLSNQDAGIIASHIMRYGHLKFLLLGHLSKVNNHPDLAHQTVAEELERAGFTEGVDFEIDITKRDQVGRLYVINGRTEK